MSVVVEQYLHTAKVRVSYTLGFSAKSFLALKSWSQPRWYQVVAGTKWEKDTSVEKAEEAQGKN